MLPQMLPVKQSASQQLEVEQRNKEISFAIDNGIPKIQ